MFGDHPSIISVGNDVQRFSIFSFSAHERGKSNKYEQT
jgi:hypothetical protein